MRQMREWYACMVLRGRTRMFSTTVVPSANAASRRARLDKDLLPGSLTSPVIRAIG